MSKFKLIHGDVMDTKKLIKALKGVDFVFHMAAHADVQSGFYNRNIDHVQNLEGTHSVLEAMQKAEVKKIAFASSSSVYGDAEIHPTPENYPFEPTSLYGATKAACESYIQTYCRYFGWQSYIFRFVSFIGERYTHGIIFDIMQKLRQSSKVLEILSDGTPKKSSLYVKDGIEAMFKAVDLGPNQVNIFNIGHGDVLTVDEIVTIILASANVQIEKRYLGGERGWLGDNNYVCLDIGKIKKLGWKYTVSIKEGIQKTVSYLQENPRFYI